MASSPPLDPLIIHSFDTGRGKAHYIVERIEGGERSEHVLNVFTATSPFLFIPTALAVQEGTT